MLLSSPSSTTQPESVAALYKDIGLRTRKHTQPQSVPCHSPTGSWNVPTAVNKGSSTPPTFSVACHGLINKQQKSQLEEDDCITQMKLIFLSFSPLCKEWSALPRLYSSILNILGCSALFGISGPFAVLAMRNINSLVTFGNLGQSLKNFLKMVIIQNLFSSFIVLSFLTPAFPLRRTSKNMSKAAWGIMQIPTAGCRYKFPLNHLHLHCTLGISTALISVFLVKTRSCYPDSKLI